MPEQVSVDKAYLEALEILVDRLTAKDGVGGLRTAVRRGLFGGVREGMTLSEVLEVPLTRVYCTRPKPKTLAEQVDEQIPKQAKDAGR